MDAWREAVALLVALLASLGWIGASLGFSLAVPILWGAARLYGTLGSLVLFLMWAYLIAWMVMPTEEDLPALYPVESSRPQTS